jgi:hypothetical protein
MRVTPIHRTVFSQRRQSQTWKVSDSQPLENTDSNLNFDLEKRNENKYLRKHLTIPQSSVIFIK